jgi:hypothetical protein
MASALTANIKGGDYAITTMKGSTWPKRGYGSMRLPVEPRPLDRIKDRRSSIAGSCAFNLAGSAQ